MDTESTGYLSSAVLRLNTRGRPAGSGFGRRVIAALSMLFGAETHSCSLTNIYPQALHATMISSDEAASSPFHSTQWGELATTDQMMQVWQTMRAGRVMAFSDLGVPSDDIQSPRFCEGFYQPLGITHQLILPFVVRDDLVASVICHQRERDFDVGQRRVLGVFGEHLALAHERTEELSSMSGPDVITNRELSWVWSGSVDLSPHGTILSMTRGAAELLPAYFGPFPRRSSLLPVWVWNWIQDLLTRDRLRTEALGPPQRAPARVARGELELCLRLDGLETGGRLSLELRHTQPIRAERLMTELGTTVRETEVIRELIRRTSQREVGEELGMSANTVRTHRQKIYEKLAVNDRVGLVMKVQELLTKSQQPEPLRLPSIVRWASRPTHCADRRIPYYAGR